MPDDSKRPREGRISTDRETIRGWADEHGSVPVRGRESETGRYRFVRKSEMDESHDRVDWDAFFSDLDESDYVVVHYGKRADEPFEVLERDNALTRMNLESEDVEERLIAGETVRSEVTETTVVERVIVEHATIESELVDTEVVDQRILDVDLMRRECTSCDLVEDRDVESRDLFDSTRYFESLGADDRATGTRMGPLGTEGELPYHAELEVEEAWSVTREIDERLTVESRIVEEDVTETDTVEERDIDIEGLQESIVETDILGVDRPSEEVLTEYDVETEFGEGETIHTYFDRKRTVEDEVVDRRRLRADIVDGELLGMETVLTEDVEVAPDARTEAETDAVVTDAATEADATVTISDDEIGKTVVDSAGKKVGMVTDVDDAGTRIFVDSHPGLTERIKAALDWGDVDEDDYPIAVDQIRNVTDDRVELKTADELDRTETPASGRRDAESREEEDRR